MKFEKKLKAFSLIELSIVILIIGVLIAGVMKGKSLIRKSQLLSAQKLTQSSPVAGMKDLAFWYETSTSSSFSFDQSVDAGNISSWLDINPQAITKLNATQDTDNHKPNYYENVINGLPVVRFNGTSDQLDINGNFLLANQSDCTFFIVVKSAATVASNARVMSYTSLPIGARGYYVQTDSNTYGFQIGSDASGLAAIATPPSITKANIVTTYRLGNTLGASVNGKAFTTVINTQTPITNLTRITFGAFSGGSGGHWAGDLGEVIFFTRYLKASERKAIEDYLGQKWGISLG